MMRPNNRAGSAIAPPFIARVGALLRYMTTGKTPSWFGPSSPLPPQAPPSVAGRQFDFPVGYNLRTRPKLDQEGVSFRDLRALADHYDLLRLVIETRKDQLAKMRWAIQPKDPNQKSNRRTRILEAFFAFPDKTHSWDEWLRMLLEDLLVIDAPTLYPRPTKSGALYALELMDGATIKRVLDETGRTPLPPAVAYQQILKGVAAINYTYDELIYRPRNLRTYKVYGFSPVEQIMMTVNIALRRQLHQLEYYRSGSVPDAVAGVPPDWQPEQIRQYQAHWDALMTDDEAARRRVKFVPGELAQNFKEIKQPPLKDQYDEWLARIVCFAFSIEPTAFVAQTNRATAQTIREQSLSEGLAPLQNWVKNLIDDVLARYLGSADFAFQWLTEDAMDPMTQAQINVMYVNAGILDAHEVRAALGFDRALDNVTHEADKNIQKGTLKPINRNRRTVLKAQKTLSKTLQHFLAEQAKHIAHTVNQLPEKEAMPWLAQLNLDWTPLYDLIYGLLTDVTIDGGYEALKQLGKLDEDLTIYLRDRAIQWAKNRSAEMVGMKWVNNRLVVNPDAKWAITDRVRQVLRQLTQEALSEGISCQTLAERIVTHEAFSPARALMIARTEMAKADVAGAMEGYRLSKVVEAKRWLTASDEKVSAECEACEAAGNIPLDANFPSGVDAPPNHPNCRCTVLPVLKNDDSP